MLTSKASISRCNLSIFIEKLVTIRKKIHTTQLVVAVASVAEFFKPNFGGVGFFFQLLVKTVLPDLKLYFEQGSIQAIS